MHPLEAIKRELQRESGPVPGGPPSVQRTALKLLAAFLSLMVLLTLLSRAADSLTVAQVTAEAPKTGALTYRASAWGKLEAVKELPVAAPSGFRVQEVAVQSGQSVRAGEVLLRLDEADLAQQLANLETELRKQEISKELLELSGTSQESEGTEAADRALEEARLDWEEVQEESGLSVARAERDLAQAQKDYEEKIQKLSEANQKSYQTQVEQAQKAYDRENAAYQQTFLSVQEALRTAARQVEDAQTALNNLQADPSATGLQIMQAQRTLERAMEDEKAAREKQNAVLVQASQGLNEAQTALEEAKRGLSGGDAAFESAKAEVEAAAENLESKERALEDALRSAQKEQRSAQRAVDSAEFDVKQAQKSAAQDREEQTRQRRRSGLQAESAQLDIDQKQKQIDALRELTDAGGVITAPLDGIVLSVGVSVGQRTTGDMAVLMADAAGGIRFRGELDEEQAKRIAAGAPGKLTLSGKRGGMEVTVDVLNPTKSSEGGDMMEVISLLPEGTYTIGASAVLDATQKTESFPATIPISALRSDGAGYYVLVIQENSTVLGAQSVAARVNVTVLEQDSTRAAVEGLSRSNQVITGSTKSISEGDRVRLQQP